MFRMQTGINKILRECLTVSPLEKTLILSDHKTFKIGKRVYETARKINLETALMVMEARTKDEEELPRHVSNAMRASDVVIAITSFSLLHTKATKIASENGARVVNLVNVSEKTFTEGGLTASYLRVSKDVETLLTRVSESNFVEVISSNGTNVYFSVRDRKWFKETGLIRNPGKVANLPAGEVYVAPVENTVNGRIVLDSFGRNEKNKIAGIEIKTANCVGVSDLASNGARLTIYTENAVHDLEERIKKFRDKKC